MTAPVAPLQIAELGTVAYEHAVAIQEALLARQLAGGPDALLLLEHPPVYTLGRGADPAHLRTATAGRVPIVRTHRGGQVTYHGPGQLIGYPIVSLRGLRPDVRWYVRMLEDVLIATLAECGIVGARRPGFPGVWTNGRKIASIGVAVRRWVTWHGFALNVGADLSGFVPITPCGIAGVEMTSIAREGGPDRVALVQPIAREQFVTRFGYPGWEPLPQAAEQGEVRP